MKTVTNGWKTVHRELVLSYEDIENLMCENGIEPGRKLVEFCTHSPGTTGMRWACLAPSDSVVFRVETVQRIEE